MKPVFLLAFILLSTGFSFSQEKTSGEIKELFNDAEFFFAQEEYSDALIDYVDLYNNGYKENANINYRIGICYLNLAGQKEKAIPYLLEAVKNVSKKYNESSLKQKTVPFDAYLFLGNAYRVNNRLNDAISAYTRYKELTGTADGVEYANQQISACNTAIRYMSNPLNIRFTNLGDSVNTNSSNFKGVVSGDGKTLLFMNEMPFYNAVFFSKYINGGWSSPINITPQIQSDGDQYVSSVSYDGTQLILTREDAFNSDLYQSSYDKGFWSRAIPLQGTDINTKFWESHGSLSRDGKTLYFTSNRKDGLGGMDLYISKLQDNGHWGKPVNPGSVINTPLNEDTPFITENDSLLYFSSQGHETMGGYDFFVSRLNTEQQWTAPVNIGYPLNTTDDDLFLYPWNNARIIYTSRIEKEGFGKEDLFAATKGDDKDLNEILASFFGATETMVAANKIDTVAEQSKEIKTEVVEQPVKQPVEEVAAAIREVLIDPVYFAFDHFQLNEAGKKQLESIALLLKEHSSARVKLIGHADAKGPADYNMKLSVKRALTTYDYLVSLGISPDRIEHSGMGEKDFVAINNNPDGSDNPEGRKLNRRVSYEIIGINNSYIWIRVSPIPEDLKIKN
jgi:outer membrane protein OmpA-like peptidoglycan-associated protein